MIMLRQTDFPAPVAPATERCGILQRSPKTGRPVMSLPSAIQSGGTWPRFGSASRISRIATIATVRFGISMPTADFPGIGASMRTLVAASASARSSASDGDSRNLDAALGLELVARDRRPALDVRNLRADAEARERVFENVRAVRLVDRLRSAAGRKCEISGRRYEIAPLRGARAPLRRYLDLGLSFGSGRRLARAA